MGKSTSFSTGDSEFESQRIVNIIEWQHLLSVNGVRGRIAYGSVKIYHRRVSRVPHPLRIQSSSPYWVHDAAPRILSRFPVPFLYRENHTICTVGFSWFRESYHGSLEEKGRYSLTFCVTEDGTGLGWLICDSVHRCLRACACICVFVRVCL